MVSLTLLDMVIFTSKGPDPETKKGIDEIKNPYD